MLELAWKGTKPITMPDGSQRSFIHDHDAIVMKAWAENQAVRIGFGEAVTTILPAIQLTK
jgi:fumarylacetoacetase